MDKAVSAADANRKFSQLLQGVRRGRSYIVTSHGKPVARISPVVAANHVETTALEILLTRLRRQAATTAVRWTREELYEEPE